MLQPDLRGRGAVPVDPPPRPHPKRARYEAAGCPSYWVVDQAVPSVRAWDLVDGAYAEVGSVSGDETWTASRPFPVSVRPLDLTRPG